jgi:hypothetical protein
MQEACKLNAPGQLKEFISKIERRFMPGREY